MHTHERDCMNTYNVEVYRNGVTQRLSIEAMLPAEARQQIAGLWPDALIGSVTPCVATTAPNAYVEHQKSQMYQAWTKLHLVTAAVQEPRLDNVIHVDFKARKRLGKVG